jgi:plasmid maintenance system antidote protein VapI
MVKIMRERMHASSLDEKRWCQQISQVSGVSEKLITGIVSGKKDLSLQTARKLIPKMAVADAELRHDATLMVTVVLHKHMQTSPLDEKAWRKQVSQITGVSELLIKDLLEGKKDLSAQTAKKLVPYLFAQQT